MNPATLTLRTFYHTAYIALVHGVRQSTLDQYDYSLRAWERFAGKIPLDRITPLTLAEFKVAVHSVRRVLRREFPVEARERCCG
jgi:hypothetical protein